MEKNNAQSLVNEVADFPAMPPVAKGLLGMVQASGADARTISSLAVRDPGIACRLLRLINNSYFNLPQEVYDLNQTAVVLGFDLVRNVALTASLDAFEEPESVSGFDRAAFWKHSLAVACASKWVAKTCTDVDPELAYTTGLLHDMAKLVLDIVCPKEMRIILENAKEKSLSFAASVRDILDRDPRELGAAVLAQWRVPRSVCEAIRHHNDLSLCEENVLIAVNAFANYIAAVKGVGPQGGGGKVEIAKTVWQTLHLSADVLPKMLSLLDAELNAVTTLLATEGDPGNGD